MSITVALNLMNDLPYNIAQCWVNHHTSANRGIDKGFAANIAPGGTANGWNMTIDPETDDLFTVIWIDSEGNIWGSPQNFSAECSLSGGNVEIDLVAGTGQVTVVQGNATKGSVPFVEYIVA